MKIIALAVLLLALALPCQSSPEQSDSLSSRPTPAGDSAGVPLADAAGVLALSDSVSTLSVPAVVHPAVQPYRKPGIAEMITDLPGAWVDWSRLTFRTENIPMYTGIGVLTAAMVITDHQTYTPLRKFYHDNKTYHDAAEVFQFMGDGWFQFGIGAALGAHGLIFNDAKSLSAASQTVEVILACGGVVQTLKHLTGRESPFVSSSPTGIWILFPNQIDYAKRVPYYDAYPSGHVATAMATLTVLTENYPDAHWLKYVGYPIIGLIGVSMMGTGIHWLSDYPLSWAIGYTFGKAVAHRHKPKQEDSAHINPLAPDADFTIMSNGAPGFALTWKW